MHHLREHRRGLYGRVFMRRSWPLCALLVAVALSAVAPSVAGARPRASVTMRAAAIGRDVRATGAVRTHGVGVKARRRLRLSLQQRTHGRWHARRTVRLRKVVRGGTFLVDWRRPRKAASAAASLTLRVVVSSAGRAIGTTAGTSARVAAPVTPTGGCPAAKIIGVRGSGETAADGGGYGNTVGSLVDWAHILDPGTTGEYVNYPAIRVAPWNPRYFTSTYNNSVGAGITSLLAHLSGFMQTCHASRVYLAGFSQGAQVVADTYLGWLSDAERARVQRLVLFGDPKFRGDEGLPPNSGTYDARLSGIVAQTGSSHRWPARDTAKVRSYCASGDPICNFSSVGQAVGCGASPACPHLHYFTSSAPAYRGETYTLTAARFLTGRVESLQSPGDTGGDAPAYPHVTALAPAAGPAGYGFGITGPPCVPAAGETAEVRVSGDDGGGATHSQESVGAGIPVREWFEYIHTERNDPGAHTATVACLLHGPGGTRTGWSEPVPFRVTAPARQVVLADPAVHAGGSLTLLSGATGGADPCPSVQGLTPARLDVETGVTDAEGGSLMTGHRISLPTASTTVSVPLPAWAPAGMEASAAATCTYRGPTTAVWVPAEGVAFYTWAPAPYTVAP